MTKDELAWEYATRLANSVDHKDLIIAYSEMVYEDVMRNWSEKELVYEMEELEV